MTTTKTIVELPITIVQMIMEAGIQGMRRSIVSSDKRYGPNHIISQTLREELANTTKALHTLTKG